MECRQLIERLLDQSYPVSNIRIINTQEEYFDEAIVSNIANVTITHIKKHEFDHGGTRKQAARESDADILVFMTQDALPKDRHVIKNLIEPFRENDRIGAVYARQLPDDNSSTIERLTRSFNYPEVDMLKTVEDIGRLGIKTYFCSNVCAAYRRTAYEKVGGFVEHAIFNEDMIMAYHLIQSGLAVLYKADARVIHAHNYTCIQQMKRNFDLGVSQAMHPEIFKGISSEGEGMKYVRQIIKALYHKGKLTDIPVFISQSGFKLIGYKLGYNYNRLPNILIKKITSNKEFWKFKS